MNSTILLLHSSKKSYPTTSCFNFPAPDIVFFQKVHWPQNNFPGDIKRAYLKINSIKLYRKERDNICSLLGSPWAATSDITEPYLVQYGYFSNADELNTCVKNIITSPSWDKVKVFYDAIKAPSPSMSFTNNFIL